MFAFTKYSKIYYLFSAILILGAIVSLILFPLKLGIEFNGGIRIQIEFKDQRPGNEEISQALAQFDLGDIIIQPTGQKGVVLQFREIDETKHQEIISKLNTISVIEDNNFNLIGPSVGQELKNKTFIAISLSLLAITIYIAFAFRKVSR